MYRIGDQIIISVRKPHTPRYTGIVAITQQITISTIHLASLHLVLVANESGCRIIAKDRSHTLICSVGVGISRF